MLPTAPLAAGITNLPMLGWLAAAAAPILIHLWSRRKYREMSWAAMEYLVAAMRRQSRRIRFEQWLLLLIRTLVIALVVLAVAEPFLERIGFVPTIGGRVHRVLVLDGSYSMAYQVEGQTRFERAKLLATQIVQQGRQGDAFTLVLMSDPPKVIVGTPALEPGEVLEEIQNLEMPHMSADLPGTVAAVRRIVQNAGPGLTRHEVYFLTDLGRVGWEPDLGRTAMADFRSQSKKLAEAADLMIVDVGQPIAENIAVTDLQSVESVTVLGQNVPLRATVRNFGRRAHADQEIELWVDGSRVDRRTKDLPPAEEISVEFSHRFETPGDHAVEVRVSGDLLEIDNRRFLSIPIRQSIRVLCVDGHPSGRPFGSATDYLALALAPTRDLLRQAPVEVEVASESAMREHDLGDFDCVFLCNVAQFTANEAQLLESYLGSGGVLVFFLGDQVSADRYNRELGGGIEGRGRILPARLGEKVDRVVQRLDPLDYRHPIIATFKDHERAGLLTAGVARYFRLILSKETGARVVLGAGGDPLIVEEAIRRGHVVLVATSADTSWTDLPVLPGYVPLVQELVAFSIAGQLDQRNVAVGRTIGASVASPVTDATLSLQGPDGRGRDVPLTADGDYNTFSYDETTISGFYTARFTSPIDRTWNFAVNVDTAESDLTQLSVARLREEIWAGVPFGHQTTCQDGEPTAEGPILRQEWIHVTLLYAVLGLLLAETFLAWRFGYHAS